GLQQPTGNWTNGFGYDAARRLTSVTSPAGTFSYAYDPIRQMKPGGIALPTSSYVTNTYDPVARVLSTLLVKSTGSTLDGASYGYNVGGQRTSFTNAAGAYVDYAYDPIGQLMVATSSTSSQDRGYLYDAAWNLQQLTNNGSVKTYTVNGLNELTAIGSTSYSYDENVSPTATTTATSTSTNTYDAENRLIAAEETTVPPKLTTFIYDGLGRLRAQSQWVWTNSGGGGGDGDVEPNGSGGGGSGAWVLTNALYYVYDGTRVIEERNVNNAPTNAYTWGPDLSGTVEGAGGIGGMLARSSGYSSGNFTSNAYYHADGNGNITYLEDSSQDLAASYEYDPYGNTLSSSGPLASANTHRFSSKEYMSSVGLYYYLYRFYDPSLQRWPNRDPLGDQGFKRLTRRLGRSDPNFYRFVGNSPVMYFDKFGLETVGQSIGCGICGVSPSQAENAFHAGQSAADQYSPGRSTPENEAMRHCVASGVLATTAGCSGSQCVGDNRERFQTDFQGQSNRRMHQGINNNWVGRSCAGCQGSNASGNPGNGTSFGPYPGVAIVIPPPPPSTSLSQIVSCCQYAIESGIADPGY